MKNFIKKKLEESYDMSIIETLLDEDYPTNFNMEHFKTLNKFTERIRYCEENLQRISSGSARIVYKVDNEKVLKLAKNEKGLAQNNVEIEWGGYYEFQSILAHTIDSHPKGLWVEMELARKVSKSDFIQYFGVSVNDLGSYLRNWDNDMHGRPNYFSIPNYLVQKMDENEDVNEIKNFMISADAPAGDFGRLSSYGKVNRKDGEIIVLIDFGLTSDVYTSYYR